MRAIVIVSRGHTNGQYLDQLIGMLTHQAATSETPPELVADIWAQKARVFKTHDEVMGLLVAALIMAKAMSHADATAVATTALDKCEMIKPTRLPSYPLPARIG